MNDRIKLKTENSVKKLSANILSLKTFTNNHMNFIYYFLMLYKLNGLNQN